MNKVFMKENQNGSQQALSCFLPSAQSDTKVSHKHYVNSCHNGLSRPGHARFWAACRIRKENFTGVALVRCRFYSVIGWKKQAHAFVRTFHRFRIAAGWNWQKPAHLLVRILVYFIKNKNTFFLASTYLYSCSILSASPAVVHPFLFSLVDRGVQLFPALWPALSTLPLAETKRLSKIISYSLYIKLLLAGQKRQ